MKKGRFTYSLAVCLMVAGFLSTISPVAAQKVYVLHLAGQHLWTATEQGLVNWNTTTLGFDIYGTANGISRDEITALVVDGDRIWVGTPGGGVCSGTPQDGWTCKMEIDGVVSNHIYCAGIDDAGVLWFGSKYDGVCSYDGSEWVTYGTAQGLINNDVRHIYGHSDGSVWFSTGGGISVLKDGVWTGMTSSDGVPSNDVRAVIEDTEGGMWAACGESMGETGGVGHRAPDGTWTRYRTPDGLGDNDVHCLAIDGSGAVWCGTFGGVSKFSDGAWENFNTSDSPLRNEWVYDIRIGAGNKIWLGTSKGLYQFDGERNWAFFSAR